MPPKMRGTATGLLTRLTVYHGHDKVGIGFALFFNDYHYRPELSTEDGQRLPEDWYTIVAESQHVVVVSLTVH
jgi:hypothetical protein